MQAEEQLLNEVWDFLKSNDKLFTQAAREKGNPLRGKWHIAKQYMWKALKEEFFIGFPVKPIQLTTGWTNLAPAEIGATVTLNGKIVLGLIHAVSPDNGEMPRGLGMIVDLACSNRFLVSYDLADWESLSAKEKLHCVCLDVNLQHPHMGYLLADFRSLLQPLKKHLTLNASNGGKIRLKNNRYLISSFKSALRPKLPKKRKRHSGDEIKRWFWAYDLYRWGMPFEEALKQKGYKGTATALDNRGLRPEGIAQRLFPERWRVASRNELSEDASPEFRELFKKHFDKLPYDKAVEKAAAELGLDVRSRSIKSKKLIQKIKDYIENAETWIDMSWAKTNNPTAPPQA